MTRKQFTAAFAIADGSEDLTGEDVRHLDGYGLPEFQPVVATLRQVASVLQWQARHFMRRPGDPKWDMEEVNSIKRLFRHRVTILD